MDIQTAKLGDRGRLQELLTALDASEPQLRRDDCGDWRILGRWGHIYAMESMFHLVAFTDECDLDSTGRRSAQRWTIAKRRLAFATVVQDGDEEGILRLDRLPTAEEAVEIRDIFGIRRRRHLSPEELARLRTTGFQPSQALQSASSGGIIATNGEGG
jgi:hypothetical protein